MCGMTAADVCQLSSSRQLIIHHLDHMNTIRLIMKSFVFIIIASLTMKMTEESGYMMAEKSGRLKNYWHVAAGESGSKGEAKSEKVSATLGPARKSGGGEGQESATEGSYTWLVLESRRVSNA
jgi:hypothetical protein